jgi:hypothetical protein
MTETKNEDLQAQQDDRLPCRGCPATCPYYRACDGKPWRMAADVVALAQ